MDLNDSPPNRNIALKYMFHADGTLGWNVTMPYCGRWSAHPNPWQNGSKH